jgi:hypothetical protein
LRPCRCAGARGPGACASAVRAEGQAGSASGG